MHLEHQRPGEPGIRAQMEDSEMKDAPPHDLSKETHISTKDWTLKNLLARGRKFRPIPTTDVTSLLAAEIELLVQKHEKSGIPLLMTGFHQRPSWDSHKFSPEWLRDVEGASRVMVRNVYDRKDRKSSILDYLVYAESASQHALFDETERLYAKDAPCPEDWHSWMSGHLPEYMLPFGVGDLSNYLPPEERVETLMTYLGVGDTYTPAHKDPCASVGQNLMVHTSNNASSFWFLTSTEDSYKASMYWRDLGQELDHESHVATVDELAKADFPIYVCQQTLGDFVIVPPQSCHQVLNSGGLTMKMSWSRMIAKSYELSLGQELRIYQRVCRPEVYRVKATIAAVVASYTEELHGEDVTSEHISRLNSFLPLYKQMLIETYDPRWKTYQTRTLDADSCDCCGADIWQSAMICHSCSPEEGGALESARTPIILCGSCYVDGRSCRCETMQPVQDRPFGELLDVANNAIEILRSKREKNREKWVDRLFEKDLTSNIHPPVFRVATFLHRYRAVTKYEQPRLCNLYRRRKKNKMPNQHTHSVGVHGTLYCGGCHSRACWYHIVEKYNTHIATIATFSDSYKALQRLEDPVIKVQSFQSDRWHAFHAVNRSTVSSHVPFGTPWEDWLPPLVWVFRSSRPLNESVSLGWYDGAHLGECEDYDVPEAVVPAIVGNATPEKLPVSQFLTSSATNSSAAPALKRKAPSEDVPESLSRRNRRLVHYAEDAEGSITDELALLKASV